MPIVLPMLHTFAFCLGASAVFLFFEYLTTRIVGNRRRPLSRGHGKSFDEAAEKYRLRSLAKELIVISGVASFLWPFVHQLLV